jgi:hypothetical protein
LSIVPANLFACLISSVFLITSSSPSKVTRVAKSTYKLDNLLPSVLRSESPFFKTLTTSSALVFKPSLTGADSSATSTTTGCGRSTNDPRLGLNKPIPISIKANANNNA